MEFSELEELPVATVLPGVVELPVWVTMGMEWSDFFGREVPLQQYATCYVSLKAAALENGLAATTVAHWVRRGRLKVVGKAEFLTGAQGWMVRRMDVDALIRERMPELWREKTKDFVYISE